MGRKPDHSQLILTIGKAVTPENLLQWGYLEREYGEPNRTLPREAEYLHPRFNLFRQPTLLRRTVLLRTSLVRSLVITVDKIVHLSPEL